jgi:hypothetical protein
MQGLSQITSPPLELIDPGTKASPRAPFSSPAGPPCQRGFLLGVV